MTARAEHAGDPRHPDHEAYLLELGRATFAAARLAGMAFDVLRVHRGHDSLDLYDDTLGKLETLLKKKPLPPLEGIEEFIELLGSARELRNDLLHALPVAHGLHRRRSKDAYFVKNFYTVEALCEVREVLEHATRMGNRVLYADGGEAVRNWTAGSSA